MSDTKVKSCTIHSGQIVHLYSCRCLPVSPLPLCSGVRFGKQSFRVEDYRDYEFLGRFNLAHSAQR
jgi:hypothetical protein